MKLRRLLTHLLDMSRLERGHLELDVEATDVARLVREVASTIQATTSAHTLVVNGERSVWASVDPLRLEQVVTNLLDNAVKFSPDGGQVNVDVCHPNEETVQIAVRDYGIGIPEGSATIYSNSSTKPTRTTADRGWGLASSSAVPSLSFMAGKSPPSSLPMGVRVSL